MSQRAPITNAPIASADRVHPLAPVRAARINGVLRYRDGRMPEGPSGKAPESEH